jgi:hypothetical protein
MRENAIRDWPKTFAGLTTAVFLLKLSRDREDIVRESETFDEYNACIDAINKVKELCQREYDR